MGGGGKREKREREREKQIEKLLEYLFKGAERKAPVPEEKETAGRWGGGGRGGVEEAGERQVGKKGREEKKASRLRR